MKATGSNRGSALVELVMVMTLLILFSLSIYTLISSGVTTQERIMKHKDAQTDARVALSYINVKLRQNDTSGKIAVEKLESTGSNAIVIRERTFDSEYDTWIFCLNGKLYECLTDPDVEPDVIDSFHIVDIDRLETEYNSDDGSVTSTVYYNYGDSIENISSTVYMRSN